MDILIIILALIPIGLLAIIIDEMGHKPYVSPMSYDEEMKWLQEDHGLTKKEAEEIANIPWRR